MQGWATCICTGDENEGHPWLWVSNRGEQHPCWHTTFPRKVVCVIPLLPADAEKGLAVTSATWANGSEQALLGGSRSGGFCLVTDEIRICSEGKIRPTGKGSKGISTPVPPQRQRPR